jgi:hypothetical protein
MHGRNEFFHMKSYTFVDESPVTHSPLTLPALAFLRNITAVIADKLL